MTLMDTSLLVPIARELRAELFRRTSLIWVVYLHTDHLDFQFGCRNSDWHRLTPSHSWLDYTTPEAWRQLVQDDATAILAAFERDLDDGGNLSTPAPGRAGEY